MIGWMSAALVAAAAVQDAPAAAPQPVSAEHQPARLDALLAAKDYSTLGRTIQQVSRQPDLVSDLDWLRARMLEGNSAFVTMLYSRLLWVAAGGLPETERDLMRQTAAMTTLYAHAAIEIDGARCGDPSAPSRRAEQLMTWNPEIWPFLRALPAETREQAVAIAVAIEARTAARRDAAGDVDFLCRYGLEETRYNLEHGTSREVPTPPGGIGTTIELTGDGGYRPSERPESERRARAAELRAALPANLAALAGAADRARPR
ncbi:MAG TPA: hypothetical protein VGW40_09300 [Allosphingosinicella sp.]|nr:hypothetical protein [Allosphingosinicella sp.]